MKPKRSSPPKSRARSTRVRKSTAPATPPRLAAPPTPVVTRPPQPAPTLSVHRLSLYNTGRLTDAELVAAFAARRPLFDRLLADLGAEKPRSRAQHHLVVGQRGMGKTMLLARLAAELRSAPFADRFIPLSFPEEQYAVDRLSKFWLNCLDSLADALERRDSKDAVEGIDATVARLKSQLTGAAGNEDRLAVDTLDAFLAAADATGRRPVLLVDNVQLVFERLAPGQQHMLRETLMREGSPILVGASPTPPAESQDYGAAFYDQFKVHYLGALTLEEMRALMLHLAEASGRPEVRARVLQHPERLAVLRQLTGGNPRTAVTLFFLYAEDFAPNVFGDLENLLDRVTPLYKARFEELSAQQQVLASAIAHHWDPVTTRELAGTAGLGLQQISPQLDRLERSGFIERVELHGGARLGFQIAERFFNVWFLMRNASRRQRREVEFLTRFLQNFYEAPDRDRLARRLIGERNFSPDRHIFAEALAASLGPNPTAGDLRRHRELDALHQRAEESRARLAEVLDLPALPPATLAFDALREKLKSLLPRRAPLSPDDFADRILGDRAMFLSGERDRLAAKTEPLAQEELARLLQALADARKRDETTYSKSAVAWFSHRLASGQLRQVDDPEDWERAVLQAEDKAALQLIVDTLPAQRGAALSEGAFEKIQARLRPAKTDQAWKWFNWAYDQHTKLGRDSTAEAAYREAIRIDPNYVGPWINLGNLYCDCLGRFDAASHAFAQALRLAPADPGVAEIVLENLIFLHRDFLGNLADARPIFERLRQLPRHEYADSLHLHAALFSAYEEHWGQARESLSKALAETPNGLPPNTEDDWMRASAVLIHLNYGAELLAFLEESGEHVRLRPWYEGLRAVQLGDREFLRNVAPEIRVTAEFFHDGIAGRLASLPASTSRRPGANASTRARRSRIRNHRTTGPNGNVTVQVNRADAREWARASRRDDGR